MANPKLRFSKQYPDWKFYQIKDIVEVNPYTAELPERFVYIDLESVDRGNLTATNIIDRRDAPSRAQRLIEKDDVLFQLVRPYQQNNLIYSDLCHLPAVASTGYAQLRPTKTVTCPSFLYTAVHTKTFLDNVLCRCTGGAYPAINTSDLSEISLSMPCLEEQQKIAEFFTALNEKIELLVKKIKFTEKLRNGLMYSLLNQQINIGQTEKKYPQWETLQLKQCVSFFKGGSLAKKDLDDDGDKPCLLYGELYTTYGCTTSKIISRTNVSSPLVVSRKNDVVLPMSGETAEEIAKATCLLVDDVAYGGDLLILRSQMLYGPFLSYALNSVHRHSISRIAQGKSVVHINATNLSEISISVPCMEEQILIADCLMHIDNKIDILDKQKKTLDAQKKAFMQRMFV